MATPPLAPQPSQATPSPPAASAPMSVDDFAAKVKAKYPDYAGMDNATLAQKIIAKYPEYAGQVDFSKGKLAKPMAQNIAATPPTPPLSQRLAAEGITPSTSLFGDLVNGYIGVLGEAGANQRKKIDDLGVRGVISPRQAQIFQLPAGALENTAEMVKGMMTPENAALSAASFHPALRLLVATYGAATSAKPLLSGAANLHPSVAEGGSIFNPLDWQGDPEAAKQLLSGASGIVGSVALAKTAKAPTLANLKNPSGPPLARTTSPAQESAFNTLHPENAVADTSMLGEARNAAAREGLTVSKAKNSAGLPREAVELPQRALQSAIDAHEAQVSAVKEPFAASPQDNAGAAAAARSKITPEMRNAAQTNPAVAKQVAEIESLAQRAEGANTVDLTDQLRHTWNDDLASELNKSAASQDVSPAVTQAKRVAASALRQGLYDNLSQLSGQDVRALAQREGQLIEAKAGVTKTGEAALKSRRNDLGAHPRTQAVLNAASKINLAKPVTTMKFLPDAVRAVLDPTSQTPAGRYAATVKRAFGGLGAADSEVGGGAGSSTTPSAPPLAPAPAAPSDPLISALAKSANVSPDIVRQLIVEGSGPTTPGYPEPPPRPPLEPDVQRAADIRTKGYDREGYKNMLKQFGTEEEKSLPLDRAQSPLAPTPPRVKVIDVNGVHGPEGTVGTIPESQIVRAVELGHQVDPAALSAYIKKLQKNQR